jgi:uncharacterized protein YggT (Ycf19 family)
VALVDFILNLVGVLLWLSWRGMRSRMEGRGASLSLAGTLQRADPGARRGGYLLGLLTLLLAGRAVVYRLLAPAASWTPKLDLALVVPAFQNEHLASLLTFSLLSFLRMLLILYFWLLALAVINRSEADSNRFQRLLRIHLGLVGRLPWVVQPFVPLVGVTLLWIALAPLLASLGVTSRVPALLPMVEQGLLIGGALFLSLKYLLPGFLIVHLVISYVYFGRSALCEFVNLTAGNLLAPLRRLPLSVGRVDFAPLVATVFILLLLHTLPVDLIPRAEKYWQVQLHPIWPQ